MTNNASRRGIGSKKTMLKLETEKWMKGYAVAIAGLIRSFDDCRTAATIMHNDGIDLKELRAAAEPFDRKALRKLRQDPDGRVRAARSAK